MFTFIKQHWLAIALWLLILLPLVSLLLVNAALLAYIFWPRSLQAVDFSRFDHPAERVVIVAHGSGDTPATWAQPLADLLREQHPRGDYIAVDWSRYAADPLRCAVVGRRIGDRIGESLASSDRVQSLHLIGHSCGAFVIYQICRAVKARRPSMSVQTTFLDPVSIYGPWLKYGVRRFGDCADYSDAFIDTADSVTGSNQLLPHTHTYDVTAVREARGLTLNPHVWPTLYYRQWVAQGRALTLENTANLSLVRPEGVLESVAPEAE